MRQDLRLNGKGSRRMNPDEVDRCAGLYFEVGEDGRAMEGDHTDAPEATEGDRISAIGNSIMIQSYLFLFSFLPEPYRAGGPSTASLPAAPPTSPGSRARPAVHERAGARGRDAVAAPLLNSVPSVPLPFDLRSLQDLIVPLEELANEEDHREGLSDPEDNSSDDDHGEASAIDRFKRATDGPPNAHLRNRD